ncbi:MAG TPA: hypothetical protein VKA46_28315 [Gemmataceae bacterium]|nr:hypothetical protein [Gemmataceae bacterium]
MRILFAIPHYVRPAGEGRYAERHHGALDTGPEPRVAALAACLTGLHQLFQPAHSTIDHGRRLAHVVAAAVPHQVEVVLCTTRGHHVLDRLPVGSRYYTHTDTGAAPELLGFACHDVLRDRLGQYDYYGYLEDDLVLHDPAFFVKLAWFNAAAGDDKLLQPNRFEAGLNYLVPKVYVDGELSPQCTAPFQNVNDAPPQTLEVLGRPVVFERTLNPHSGCFFLNARQMAQWARQPHFADRQSRFIGPLETAASLGIMRTFKVYKPALANADFLEVQHHATGYLAQLRLRP